IWNWVIETPAGCGSERSQLLNCQLQNYSIAVWFACPSAAAVPYPSLPQPGASTTTTVVDEERTPAPRRNRALRPPAAREGLCCFHGRQSLCPARSRHGPEYANLDLQRHDGARGPGGGGYERPQGDRPAQRVQ